MTIHTKYGTYIFQAAFNNQDVECYLATKTHDKLVEAKKGCENSMVLNKPYECMAIRMRTTAVGDVAVLYLHDRVVTTSPVLATLGLPQGRTL